MKSILKIDENEKNRILEMHKKSIKENRNIIFEQTLTNIVKVLGDDVSDDVAKNFTDDAAKQIDNFALLVSNSINKSTGKVMSATGNEYPLSQIQNVFRAIAKGTADESTLNLLPRYLMSNGKSIEFRAVVAKIKPKTNVAKAGVSSVGAAATLTDAKTLIGNYMNSTTFKNNNLIDWSKITNAKNIDDYNKLIAKAISTGDYSKISRGGFEKLGITNFRETLMKGKDFDSKIYAIPSDGFWSFKVTGIF